MDAALTLCNSLITWLQSLDIEGPQKNASEISDGVAVAQALVQIAPEHFSTSWISKIKPDVGTNRRLKVSNLKKIVEGIIEYYQEYLNLNILDSVKPDVMKIGEHADYMELGKLLQLVLGCAVNCNRKQEYITRIMSLEESVQQCIMQAIQSLEEATRGRGPFSLSFVGGMEMAEASILQRLTADLDSANESKDILAQRCYDLESQVKCLTDEKLTFQSELLKLHNRIEELEGNIDDVNLAPSRTTELRRQIDSLKEDLFKMETARDDYRIKVYEYEKQIATLQSRIDELQLAADRAMQLKDEVDALTETADRVQTMELTVASYKKKLEEYADLKKQLKILEDKNTEYYQQILSYEEDSQKITKWKTQIDLYKKQLTELHQKFDEEIQKVYKAEFENKKLDAQLQAALREKDALAAERDALKETNEELRCGTVPKSQGGDVAGELAAPELRERVALLEKENRSLKSASTDPASAALLEDVTQRNEQLRNQLRASQQRIFELEAKLEEKGDDALKQKCTALQEALNTKEAELAEAVEKQKKYTEKARDAIRCIQVRTNTDEVLARAERNSGMGFMKEKEEQLIVSAYFNLGESCQTEAVDKKLAALSASQGATFLSRQRQPTPRKSLELYKQIK